MVRQDAVMNSSSTISDADYDPWSHELSMCFASGGTYTFYRVPEWVCAGLVNASSPGSYYNTYIRGRYR